MEGGDFIGGAGGEEGAGFGDDGDAFFPSGGDVEADDGEAVGGEIFPDEIEEVNFEGIWDPREQAVGDDVVEGVVWLVVDEGGLDEVGIREGGAVGEGAGAGDGFPGEVEAGEGGAGPAAGEGEEVVAGGAAELKDAGGGGVWGGEAGGGGEVKGGGGICAGVAHGWVGVGLKQLGEGWAHAQVWRVEGWLATSCGWWWVSGRGL